LIDNLDAENTEKSEKKQLKLKEDEEAAERIREAALADLRTKRRRESDDETKHETNPHQEPDDTDEAPRKIGKYRRSSAAAYEDLKEMMDKGNASMND
jgi:hypothetical protein